MTEHPETTGKRIGKHGTIADYALRGAKAQMEETNTKEIVARRFGLDHDKPCKRPDVITCAQWRCQMANECRWDLMRNRFMKEVT